MGFYERIDTRGAWETGRPVSFIPKGALTHHPEGAVVLPVATVRSARRMRLHLRPKSRRYAAVGLRNTSLRLGVREPYVQCHSSANLLSLATQLVAGVATYTKYRRFNRRYSTNCPHKPATGSFVCGYDPNLKLGSFSFCEKETKTRDERTVRTNGDLPLGSKGGQPRYRAFCCGCFRISELHQ